MSGLVKQGTFAGGRTPSLRARHDRKRQRAAGRRKGGQSEDHARHRRDVVHRNIRRERKRRSTAAQCFW
jgi:hypothetical protein